MTECPGRVTFGAGGGSLDDPRTDPGGDHGFLPAHAPEGHLVGLRERHHRVPVVAAHRAPGGEQRLRDDHRRSVGHGLPGLLRGPGRHRGGHQPGQQPGAGLRRRHPRARAAAGPAPSGARRTRLTRAAPAARPDKTDE